MTSDKTFDVVVVGGGPAGATVANDLARQGRSVLLLDRAGRIKPCGGAIPPRLIRDFEIPDDLLCAKITSARMISPSGAEVDMPVGKGFVGMVNREEFDEFLRARAADSGAAALVCSAAKTCASTSPLSLKTRFLAKRPKSKFDGVKTAPPATAPGPLQAAAPRSAPHARDAASCATSRASFPWPAPAATAVARARSSPIPARPAAERRASPASSR